MLAGALAGGCGAAATAIVPAADLDEGGGRPAITAVDDRGGGDIIARGTLARVAGDGGLAIGEVLHIRGRNFGRQPTVAIAGNAVAVVSRSGDGGILARVPPGTPAGPQRLSVSTEGGQGERDILVRRLAVARVADALFWLDVRPSGPATLGMAALPEARGVAISPDGRAAYGLDASGTLHVYELAALDGPVARGKIALGKPARAMLAPPGAQRLVVVGERELIELDTAAPFAPSAAAERPLPAWAYGRRNLLAALSPDGRRIALGAAERNRIVVMELSQLRAEGAGKAAGEIAIGGGSLAPIIADLTFAPDGRTLWVASGITPAGAAMGPQPTRVHAVRINEGPGGALALDEARVVAVEGATRPQAIATGRARPLASGAAIRLPPERATVHLAAYGADGVPRIFSIGADDVARPAAFDQPAGVISRPEVLPDDSWLLALGGAAGGRDAGAGDWRVYGVALDKGGEIRSIQIPAERRGAGASAVEVKVQP